jgi:hypothetical protein
VFQFALVTVILLALSITGLREYFVVMPTVYRPHLEQVMNWFGLENSSDVDFVLIYTEPVHEDWRPYLFRELLADHKFTLIDAEAFLQDENALASFSNVAVFYNPEHAGQIPTKLLHIYPDAQRRTFYNRDHKPVAQAIIEGDVNTPVPVSFFEGLLAILTSPVVWVLIPVFLLLVVYWRSHKQDLGIRPLFIAFEAGQAHQPDAATEIKDGMPESEKQPSREGSETPGFFEIGFFIRFSSGDNTHRFEPKWSVQFDEKGTLDSQEEDTHA